MICKRCAEAADRGQSPEGHCFGDCDCQHRPIVREPETVEEFDAEFDAGEPVEILAKALRDAGPEVATEVLYRLEDDALRASPDLQESLAQLRRGEGKRVVFAEDGSYTLEDPIMLTSKDPEPPQGSRVLCLGKVWKRTDDDCWDGKANWQQEDAQGFGDGDPETWTKVAGNYGPVELLTEES